MVPNHVLVTVISARNLNYKGKSGKNDAFVVFSVGGEAKARTEVKRSAAPIWDEECEFYVPHLRSAYLDASVFHRTFLGLEEFLGQIHLSLDDLYEPLALDEAPRNRWYPLKGKAGKKDEHKYRGELELRLKFVSKPPGYGSSQRSRTLPVGSTLNIKQSENSADVSDQQRQSYPPGYDRRSSTPVFSSGPPERLSGSKKKDSLKQKFKSVISSKDSTPINGVRSKSSMPMHVQSAVNLQSILADCADSPVPPARTKLKKGHTSSFNNLREIYEDEKQRAANTSIDLSSPVYCAGEDFADGEGPIELEIADETQGSEMNDISRRSVTIRAPRKSISALPSAPVLSSLGVSGGSSTVTTPLRLGSSGHEVSWSARSSGSSGKGKDLILGRGNALPPMNLDLVYDTLTKSDLIDIIKEQRLQLAKQERRMRDLEEYVDNLLAKVMETNPELLKGRSRGSFSAFRF